MLITFSRYFGGEGAGSGPDRFLPLTRYMDAPVVMKQLGPRREAVPREPRPEILVGCADTLRRTLAGLPFRRRYASLVLSFAREDIDCAAFNAGDSCLRGQVDLTLQLVLDLAWAGIPPEARPVCYATTHSHTGRLEVNLALPRAVFRPDGRIMSHNPHPPGTVSRSFQAWGRCRIW